METGTNEEQKEDSIYTGTMPTQAEQSTNPPNEDEELAANERKKYHSSAMYAASKWHNTVSHVKAHSNRGLDL